MRVAEAVVAAALPAAMVRRFDPGAARDLVATFELELSGTRYAVLVERERCRVERRAAPEAGARVRISAGDLVRLASGATEWTTLLGQRRLELGGDPFLALRFPKLFRLAAARSPAA